VPGAVKCREEIGSTLPWPSTVHRGAIERGVYCNGLSSFFAICLWVSAESNVEFAEPTIVNDGQGALISIFAPVLFSPLQVSSLPFSSLLKQQGTKRATCNEQQATSHHEQRSKKCVCVWGGRDCVIGVRKRVPILCPP
jgi:hypothetical protein